MIRTIGALFYLVNPWEHMYGGDDKSSVPDLVSVSAPWFFVGMIVEATVLAYKSRGKESFDKISFADVITNFTSGALMLFSHTLPILRGAEFALYAWTYDKIHIVELPYDSIWTWLLSFLAVDFVYYIYHRCGHELNFFWAHHVVHHSSEYYNLSTAMRQGVMFNYLASLLYLPAALFMHPLAFLVHFQLNTLYQYWIHSELVPKLGPLEWVLNTASHHRVHHGRNRYCIDKNYGGTLIIWDRMFGTFAEEQEEVVYGLTHNINTFNAWTVQTHQFLHMLRQFWSVPGWGNKLKVLFYGPGWSVGKPRLGDPNDIPDVHAPVLKHQSTISLNMKILVTVLFANCVILALALLDRTSPMSPLDNAVWLPFQLSVIAIISAFIFCAGLVFDSHPAAPYFLYGLALVNCVGYGSIYWTSSSDMFAAIMPLSPTGLIIYTAGNCLFWGLVLLVLPLIGPIIGVPNSDQVVPLMKAPTTPKTKVKELQSPPNSRTNSPGARELKNLAFDWPERDNPECIHSWLRSRK